MYNNKLDLKILKKCLGRDNLKGNHTYFGRRKIDAVLIMGGY